MASATPPEKGKYPDWSMQAFQTFIDSVNRQQELLTLSRRGIRILLGMPQITKAHRTVTDALDRTKESEDSYSKRLEHSHKEASLAKREVDEDFPLLHAQAVVLLWATLESSVRSFFVELLKTTPETMDIEPIQKLRVKLGEFSKLDGDEKFYYILSRLEQEVASSLKVGVSRFECIFQLFGLSGPIAEALRKDMMELQQVRNIIVHKSNIVDRQFCNLCPWKSFDVGHTLRLSEAETRHYFGAVNAYVLELIIRLGERQGVDLSKFKQPSLLGGR